MSAALQLNFLDAPAQMHSPTSISAAREIEPASGTLRARVLYELQTRGEFGATDEEIQFALDMNPSTERPRRIELVKAGSVYDGGMTRKTQSGRSAVVWRVA